MTPTVGFRHLAPTRYCLGREIQLSLPNGEHRRCRFALVSLDDLLASHDERSFGLTPGYPQLADGRSVNDRNYSADRNAQAEVRRVAQALEPGRLLTTSRTPAGSPIATVDLIAVSGNNRTMSLKLAAREYPAQYQAYLDELAAEWPAFGLASDGPAVRDDRAGVGDETWVGTDPQTAAIWQIHQPVLVRIDYDFPAYEPAELAKFNQSTMKGERPVDRALKLAAQLRANGGAARILANELGGYDTFTEFYASAPAVRVVREALLQAGVVLPQEISTYFIDGGGFTEAGRQLLERAAAGLVLSADALRASEAEGLGTLRQVVATSLPVLLHNDALPAAWRLMEALSGAVLLQHQISRSAVAGGSAASVEAFGGFVRTGSLDGAAPTREAMVLNRLLVAGRRTFKGGLEAYNQSADEASGGIAMFGAVTPAEAFAGHLEKRLDEKALRVINLVAGAAPAIRADVPPVQAAIPTPVAAVPRWAPLVGEHVEYVVEEGGGAPPTWYPGTVQQVTPASDAGPAGCRVLPDHSFDGKDFAIQISRLRPLSTPAPATVAPAETDDQAAEKIRLLMAGGIVPEAGQAINLLIGGNWFKLNPEKLLGTPKLVSTRFGGQATVLTGKLADAMARVAAPVRHATSAPAVPLTAATPRAMLADDPDARTAARAAVVKSEQRIAATIVKPAGKAAPAAGVAARVPLSFDEALSELNRESALTDAHHQAFAWHKSEEGDPIGGEYGRRFGHAPTEDRLRRWIEMGIACYDGERYQYAALFYAGNCYARLNQLQRHRAAIVAAVGEAQYERQYAEMLRRRPAPLSVEDPKSKNRLMLKPTSTFARQFVVSTLADGEPFTYTTTDKHKNTTTHTHTKSLFSAFFGWLNTIGPSRFSDGATAHEVQGFYLNGGALPNPDRLPSVEAQNARIRQRSRANGDEFFAEFLATQLTPYDRTKLEAEWNAAYNAWIAPDLTQIPVVFRWARTDARGQSVPVKWEKREAVAFMLTEGSGVLAYDVGVGKTFSATFAIEQALEIEYCERPLIVTPNQVYKQFIAEIKGLLPHRQVNGFYNLGTEMRDTVAAALDGDGQVPAGSITVITKEGMEMLGLLPGTLMRLKGQLYDILNQGIESQRELAALMMRLETMLGKSQRGSQFAIEELGFDYLCVDEAHSLKKSFTSVKGKVSAEGTREKSEYKLMSGEPSALALRGFSLAHYIMDTFHGRNVLALTATPFTNSPLEVYSMLALVAFRKLKAEGRENLKDFFDTYVAISNELVVLPTMKVDYRQVVMGFNNLHSLQALVRRFILYKSGEDVGVERPNKLVLPLTLRRDEAGNTVALPANEVVLTRLPMTALQQHLMNEVVAYVDGEMELSEMSTVPGGSDALPESDSRSALSTKAEASALSEKEKKNVRVLRGINFARSLALSPYLMTGSKHGAPSARQYVESSPKLAYVMQCIAAVRDYHRAHGLPVGGQIIYMDRGIEFFPLIREYLIHQVGFAEHEVAMVSSGLTADKKERIKNGFLGKRVDAETGDTTDLPEAQRVKIIIGSSTIKEGLNLQSYGAVLYNCFLDWNPTDIKQLEGRIWRYGNKFANVVIVNPMLENSADAFIFQKLQEKTNRIIEIWAQAGKENALKLEEFNPAEMKMALLTDPDKAARAQVSEKKAKAEGHIAQLKARQAEVHALIAALPKARELEAAYRAHVLGLLKPNQQEDARAGGWDERPYDSIRRRHLEIIAADYQWKPERAEFALMEQLRLARRTVTGGQVSIMSAFQVSEAELPALVERVATEQIDAEKRIDADFGEVALARLVAEITAQRAANDAASKPVETRVEEFKRLLPLLRQLAPGEKVPVPKPRQAPRYKSCPPIEAGSTPAARPPFAWMRAGVPAVDEQALAALRRCLFELPSTKSLHVDERGHYAPDRQTLHTRIVEKYARNRPCTAGKPVAVLTGGLPGSGKSHLINNSPFKWMNDDEHVVHVDADAVRAELPEYEGWNANSTHEETKDLVNQILDSIGTPCTTDMVYDGTMNKLKSYLPLIERLRGYGYEIYVLFVRVPFAVSRERVLGRYQRTGRYVPIEVIQDAYNAGDDALLKMKAMVDGYVIYDGVTGEETERGGRRIPGARAYVELEPTATGRPAPAGADAGIRARRLRLAKAKATAQKQRVRVLQLAGRRTPATV